MRPIVKLLPDTYVFPDAQAERVLRFNRRYHEEVASGEKTSSVRWGETLAVGPVVLYFEEDDGPPLQGEIVAVNRFRLSELTADRLRLPDGGTVEGYVEGLRGHYPELPADAEVDVVDFTRRR